MMANLQDYLDLITSEHQDKPDYVATVALRVQPYIDMQNLLAGMPALFDLDVAIGDQLDKTGLWIGLTRFLEIPLSIYFSWDTAGLGWDQGVWSGSYSPGHGIVALDDPHYRILLKARVVANQWDGTIPGAYTAWNDLFAPEGYQILIQDGLPAFVPFFTWDDSTLGWDQSEWIQAVNPVVSGDMTIIFGLIAPPRIPAVDAVTRALLTGGYLGLQSAGVMVRDYALQTVIGKPMLGFDAGPPVPSDLNYFDWDTQAAGFDQGVWDDTPIPPPVEAPTAPPTSIAGWDIGCWAELIPGS